MDKWIVLKYDLLKLSLRKAIYSIKYYILLFYFRLYGAKWNNII